MPVKSYYGAGDDRSSVHSRAGRKVVAMRSSTLRVIVAVVAAGAFAAGILTSQFSFVVLGTVAALLLASSFSQAGRLTEPLQRFRHQAVAVRVWGASLPVPNG